MVVVAFSAAVWACSINPDPLRATDAQAPYRACDGGYVKAIDEDGALVCGETVNGMTGGTIAGAVTATDFSCANCIGPEAVGDGLGIEEVDENVFQLRVGQSCASGSTIQAINADGSVICVPGFDESAYQRRVSGACAVGASIKAINADGTVVCEMGLQRRVSGTCAVGSSVRAINADGTVDCEIDTDTVLALSCLLVSNTCANTTGCQVSRPVGYFVTGGGCSGGNGYPTGTGTAVGWICGVGSQVASLTAYAIVCRLQ
jgi:hypothetical protein